MQGETVARTLAGATYVVLAALGVLLATVEAFLAPQRLVGGVEGLSLLIALVGNAGVGLLGGLGTETTGGAIAPALGWVVAAVTLTFVVRGGDVVLAGRLPADPGVVLVSSLLLPLGLVASIVPIGVTSRYTRRANPPKGTS